MPRHAVARHGCGDHRASAWLSVAAADQVAIRRGPRAGVRADEPVERRRHQVHLDRRHQRAVELRDQSRGRRGHHQRERRDQPAQLRRGRSGVGHHHLLLQGGRVFAGQQRTRHRRRAGFILSTVRHARHRRATGAAHDHNAADQPDRGGRHAGEPGRRRNRHRAVDVSMAHQRRGLAGTHERHDHGRKFQCGGSTAL